MGSQGRICSFERRSRFPSLQHNIRVRTLADLHVDEFERMSMLNEAYRARGKLLLSLTRGDHWSSSRHSSVLVSLSWLAACLGSSGQHGCTRCPMRCDDVSCQDEGRRCEAAVFLVLPSFCASAPCPCSPYRTLSSVLDDASISLVDTRQVCVHPAPGLFNTPPLLQVAPLSHPLHHQHTAS
ncbi:hypothetical protein BV20DRAFT_416921 [Pilatotrama ljubarskyi]|nr:hypothetical protein BV20DRAFT_416921 [Pilatotrama ljubarskyi]